MKLFPSFATNDVSDSAADRSVPIPFMPQRRVSRRTALWAGTVGVVPVLIYKLFAAGARERRMAKLKR